MKRLFLLALLCACATVVRAQEFNQSYNFTYAPQTNGPMTGQDFTNSGVSSWFIQWQVAGPVTVCAVEVDSSNDGVTWGSADVIASQNCKTANGKGSASSTTTFSSKYVRINVTSLVSGSLNVTLKGYFGSSASSGGVVAFKPAANSGIQFVDSVNGSNSSDGLSWGTAVKDIYTAWNNLPGAFGCSFGNCGGTIYLAQTVVWGGPISGQGLQIAGPGGTHWNGSSPPPSGWVDQKAVTIACVGSGSWSSNNNVPVCTVTGNDSSHVGITFDGTGDPMEFDGIGATGKQGVNIHGANLTFRNCDFGENTSVTTNGPGVFIGQGAFQINFYDSVFHGNQNATGGTSARQGMDVDYEGNVSNLPGQVSVYNSHAINGDIECNGCNGLIVNGFTTEAQTDTKGAVWITSVASTYPHDLKNVIVADNAASTPAVQNDGNATCFGSGLAGGSGSQNVVGSCTIVSQNSQNLQSEVSGPLKGSQPGFQNGWVYGKRDDTVSLGSTTTVRYANSVSTSCANWGVTNFAGTNTLTCSIADRFGTTNAGSATSTSATGEQLFFTTGASGQQAFTLSVGEYIVAGVLTRSTNSNGYSGNQFVGVNLNSLTAGFTLVGSCDGDSFLGDGQWTWSRCIYKVTAIGTNPDLITFQVNFNSSFPVQVSDPVLVFIPPGASANEVYNFENALTPYSNACAVGSVCDRLGNLSVKPFAATPRVLPTGIATNGTLTTGTQQQCLGNGGATTIATPYTIASGDFSCIDNVTGSGTVTLPDAGSAGFLTHYDLTICNANALGGSGISVARSSSSVFTLLGIAGTSTSYTLQPSICSYVYSPDNLNWTVQGLPTTQAPNTTVVTWSPNCGGQVNCFTVNANTKQTNDATFNATTTITTTGNWFAATDVGKSISAFSTCQTNASAYVSEFGTTATTISGFTNGHTITVSHATSGSVTNTGCLYWWTPDDTNIATAITALAGYTNTCPAVQLPMGIMGTQTAIGSIAQPNGCNVRGAHSGASGLEFGFTIEGYGPSMSGFFFGNAIPLTSTVLTMPQGSYMNNWSIDGGGNPGTGTEPGGIAIVQVGGATFGDTMIHDWGCFNLGQSVTGNLADGQAFGLVGLSVSGGQNFFNDVIVDGCGFVGTYVGVNGGMIVRNFWSQDATKLQLYQAAGSVVYGDPMWLNGTPLGAAGWGCMDANSGATGAATLTDWHSGSCTGNFATQQGTAYNCFAGTVGCTVKLGPYVTLNTSSGATGSNMAGLVCLVNCSIYLNGATVVGTGTNGALLVNTPATMTLFDTGPPATLTGGKFGTGTYAGFGSATITGTACATGNWALTSGWGTSSIASVTANGDSHRCQVVITGAAGSASPVLTWTFPTAYIITPPGSCQISFNGTLTGESTGAPSLTSVAFTFTGTPSAQTYRLDASCGP